MLDYFRKFYEKLASSIFDPFFEWVLALSWPTRLLAFVLIGTGIWLWQNPHTAKTASAYSTRMMRVLVADANEIPLEKHLALRVDQARARLLTANRSDVNLIETGDITGWSAAQTLMAIAQPDGLTSDEEKMENHIRATRLPACHCWAELNGEDERRAWTFVSGWVLAALASKQQPASDAEIDFLLNNQNPDGSWSSLPRKDLSGYASVYTTSWAVSGLLSQLNSRLIADRSRIAQARSAVSRGAAWLLRNRNPNARWKAYPNLQSSSISGSVSGLAMHTLHMAMPEEMVEIDKAWLDNLPDSPVPASLGENTYVEIKHQGTVQIDHFVQLTMPWMLIGTVDAYPNGSIFEKTRALTWIEQTLSHESVRNADSEQNNWWRAELLIALNYLHQHLAKKPIRK